MTTRARQALVFLGAVFATVAAAQTGTVPLKDLTGLGQSSEHVCALGSSGTLYCWGSNTRGQLGDGTTNARTLAAPILGLASSTLFAVGGNADNDGADHYGHTCARTSAGALKCWGANESGQLGDGTTTDRLTPVDVTGLSEDVVQVVAGGRHTCVVTISGAARCWGLNDVGQLGDGTTLSRSTPADVVGLSSGVRFLAAAYKHTCAAMIDGSVKCWGSNGSGELGDGTTTNRPTPTNVVGLPAATPVDSLSAGGGGMAKVGSVFSSTMHSAGSETCAVANGTAYCWGQGNVSPVQRATDVRSIAARTGASAFRFTSCCTEFATRSCAVRSDTSATCWDFLGPDAPRSITLGLSGAARAVTTGTFAATCALVGSSAVSPAASDHVECGAFGGLSTISTTASGLIPQSIVFGPPTPTVIANVGDSLALAISAGGSGNPVVLQSSTPAVCSVSGTTVTGLARGKCIILADQAGNAQYDAAPQTTLTLRVGDPLPQTITFGAAPLVAVGGAGTVSATATSGLPVSFASDTSGICSVFQNVVEGIAAETCTVRATQAGDFFYAAAPAVTQSFPVGTGRVATYALIVGNSSSSGGRIVSSPAGIDCGPSSSCGALFPSATRVTLTVTTPASSGSGVLFGGWSGDCSGYAPCVVTMNANKSVSTRFVTYTGTLATTYRLYSPATAEHLYTSNLFEYRYLSNQVDTACCGWTAEGPAYQVMAGPASIADALFIPTNSVPFYRLYNPFSYQHHWTTELTEYNTLGSLGWSREGIAWYVFPQETVGTVPLYRLYINARGGLHLWTTNVDEKNYLSTVAGWTYEGIAAYVIPLP